MIDNDKIAYMMGGKKPTESKNEKVKEDNWETQLISGFKNKTNNNNNNQKSDNWEEQLISGFKNKSDNKNQNKDINNMSGAGNALKNVPPTLILGIILLSVPSFYPPVGFLRVFGIGFIVFALFSKVIPKENKDKAKTRIKYMWARFKLDMLEKKLEKEEKKSE